MMYNGPLEQKEIIRILKEGTETYSDELSDLLWPHNAPHNATISVEPRANMHGSYYDRKFVETIIVDIPKSVKAEIEIRTVKGSDELWRGGLDVSVGTSGTHSGPSVNSKPFKSQAAAIRDQASKIADILLSGHEYEYEQSKKLRYQKVIDIFRKWRAKNVGDVAGQMCLFVNSVSPIQQKRWFGQI